jgi:CubicO group peptidase (beta-lactamase class C family)
MPGTDLGPLPTQPANTPWPTEAWPETGDAGQREQIGKLLDAHFGEAARERLGETHALLVVQGGRLVAERYAEGFDASSTLPSWSMAKSILQSTVGVLVREGRLDVDAPAPVPAWQGPDDPRRDITLDELLRMSSGLQFQEAYTLDAPSDVVEMLFRSGQEDVAGFAERFPLAQPRDTWWNYSSGTSNIVSAIVHRTLGLYGDAHRAWLFAELFSKLGMTSCLPKYDAAGTWIASSFNFATARDFARFGLLQLRDGVWDGERILPEGWVDYARTVTPTSQGWYGAHFWRALDGSDRFSCNGFRCQYIIMDPERDLVIVRSGDTEETQREALWLALDEVIEAWPTLA